MLPCPLPLASAAAAPSCLAPSVPSQPPYTLQCLLFNPCRRSYLILRIAVKQLTTGGAGAGCSAVDRVARGFVDCTAAGILGVGRQSTRLLFMLSSPLPPPTLVAEDIREVEEEAARQRQKAATPKGKRVASVGSMPTPD